MQFIKLEPTDLGHNEFEMIEDLLCLEARPMSKMGELGVDYDLDYLLDMMKVRGIFAKYLFNNKDIGKSVRDNIYKHFVEGKTLSQISREKGVSVCAVSSSITKFIDKKIKNRRRMRSRENLEWNILEFYDYIVTRVEPKLPDRILKNREWKLNRVDRACGELDEERVRKYERSKNYRGGHYSPIRPVSYNKPIYDAP